MIKITTILRRLTALTAILLIAIVVLAQKPMIEWQKIPAGTFTMGSPTGEADRKSIETPHKVTLSEWCIDWYGDYQPKAQTNPLGPAVGKRKISRGGGWMYPAERCRSADRGSGYPADRNGYRGFRLVNNQP